LSFEPSLYSNKKKIKRLKKILKGKKLMKDPVPSSGSSASEDKSDHDEISHLMKSWAHELSQCNTQQQLFAKKAISDILFEARMGGLHRYSVAINVAPVVAPNADGPSPVGPPVMNLHH
jgi:hypothetical protein